MGDSLYAYLFIEGMNYDHWERETAKKRGKKLFRGACVLRIPDYFDYPMDLTKDI